MQARRAAVAALFISLSIVALGGAPAPTWAASNGLAWDAVTRIVMTSDASSLQPGSFDADYAAAAAAAPPNLGIAARFMGPERAAAAQYAEQMLKSGIAERHYVAGSKERIDQVSSQTATITDCAARTVTTLDLKAKTYRVESMDSSQTGGSGGASGGASGGSGGKNDVRLSIAIDNTALGRQQVGGLPANGFRSKMTFTETSSSGPAQSQNADVLGYYSSYADPSPSCRRAGPGSPTGAQGMEMAGYARLMRALSTTGDPHFNIKQSGPPLPLGKLAMYSAMTFATQGHGATFLTERGNVRPISTDDPIFTVPGDFTQQR